MQASPKEKKALLRRNFLEKRRAISASRRLEAREKVLSRLIAQLKSFTYVLSFASHKSEIDLWPLNRQLAQEGRLVLLRIASERAMLPYLVTDIDRDLKPCAYYNMLEPSLTYCLSIPIEDIHCALIPGVAFDAVYHRLGYGKGYYDYFLSKLSSLLWGVGFKEQLFEGKFPVEPHDVQLEKVWLF